MSVKVLYVEDELFLGKIVKETLELRGFEVVMESDGADVMKAFEAAQPDICILDVMLPNRSGFELAEDIRKLNDDVPIIFLTAKTQTEDVVQGFKIGANDYIRKPFSIEELIARIENALRIRKEDAVTISGDAISIGKYQFHLNKQALIFGKEERKLSYRESELLKYLYQKRDQVIDRRDLLNHIWGNDSFFNSRNLDVYITKIRGYLKEDPSLEIITIKGVGYRFVL
ncbi:MAG: response regulator transcription factor [Bacteroidetes bacterium]|nr:response regulator transcription factor [Bacteroidota bacterium]